MNDGLSSRDVLVLKKLGMEGYLGGISIIHSFPKIRVLPELSKSAKQRLKWLDHYHISRNAAKTCRYFGIAPKTFYKWAKRYDPNNLSSLEEHSRRPKTTRDWQVTREEERRIQALRARYIRYGKMKLQVIYSQIYKKPISSWKIQRVIQKHQLYYNPKRNLLTQAKKHQYQSVKRITKLTKEPRSGFLLALDTIVLNVYGYRRYILTGVDVYGKIAFARMYPGMARIMPLIS